jgi:nitrite reductase/ring-hydroxylating ferredoxin subunit
VADFSPGRGRRVERDGRACFVHGGPQGFSVFDSRCPHEATDIPASACKGASLACPKHGWIFDLASGQCTAKGDRPLTRRESKVEDGRLFAFW